MFIENEIKNRVEAYYASKKTSLMDALGIEFIHIEKAKLVATMPVTENTRQPYGLLHGGASAALAETVASVAGWLNVNPEVNSVVGMELSINHLRPTKEGKVEATGVPLHLGRKTQLWDIRILNEAGKLAAISRCSLAVIEKPAILL